MKNIIVIRKTITILFALLLVSNCTSQDEKLIKRQKELIERSQNIMIKQIQKLKSKFPYKVDNATTAKDIKFNKKTNEVIYIYEINKEILVDMGINDFESMFKIVEKDKIKSAIKNQGTDTLNSILKVTLTYIYKDTNDEVLYTFNIKPKQYININ